MSEAKQEIDLLNTPEINKAANIFTKTMPQIKARSRQLNGRAVARVLSALVEYPLGDGPPKFVKKEEYELFMMCLSAVASKDTMTEQFLKNREHLEKIKAEAEDNIVSSLLETKETK